MSILPELSPLQKDIEFKNSLIVSVGEAVNHLAAMMQRANQQFWGIETTRLLAILNEDVPVTLATFAANTELAGAVNAQLDGLDLQQFTFRAPMTKGREDIVFDGTEFVYVSPVIVPDPNTP
jgi:hypothetical protein